MNFGTLRRRVRTCLACLSGTALAGCAAMTVDVDVYKGPLINDPHVQLEQVTALAMGAKPLLIQLRDRLELEGREDRLRWQFDAGRSELDGAGVERERYQARFIPRSERYEIARLGDEYARQVNAVLYLYDDESSVPLEITSLWRRLNEAIVRYARAEADLDLDLHEATEAAAMWMGLARAFRRAGAPAGLSDNAVEWRERLFEAYQIYATSPGDFRPKTLLFDETSIREDLSLADNRILGDRRWPQRDRQHFEALATWTAPGTTSRRRGKSNGFFWFMSRRDLAERHARLFFGPNWGRDHDRFVSSVTGFGDAYLRAREALDDALGAVLLLVGITKQIGPGHLPKEQLDKLDRTYAELIDDLVGDAISDIGWEPTSGRRGASPDGGAVPFSANAVSVAAAIASAKADDRPVLETTATPEDILELHLEAKRTAQPPAPSTTRYRYAYGVAAGPASNDVDGQDLMRVTALPGFAGGLEGGRPEEGLERLITEYTRERMRHHYEIREVPDPVKDRRDRLLVALVHFAQKLQILANYSQLIENNSPELRSYQQMLQSIATAILTQIDELRKLQASGLTSAARRPAEVAARRAAWDQGAASQLKSLSAALRASKAAADAAKADAAKAHEAFQAAASATSGCADAGSAAWRAQAQSACRDAALGVLTTEQRQAFKAALASTPATGDEATLSAVRGLWSKVALLDVLNQAATGGDDAGDLEAPGDESPDLGSLAERMSNAVQEIAPTPADQAGWAWDGFEACLADTVEVPTGSTVFTTRAAVWNALRGPLGALRDAAVKEQASAWRTGPGTNETSIGAVVTDYASIVEKAEGDRATVLGERATAADALETAVRMVETHTEGFLRSLDNQHAGLEIADAFAAHLEGVDDDATKAARRASATLIRAHRGVTAPLPFGEATSLPGLSLDVIDETIAMLEYQQALEISRGGAKSQRAIWLGEAADALRRRRTDQTFLRPSSAYLRNSYAVTAFQRQPPLTIRNILISDGAPLSSSDLRTASDIDRQFWQNINHIYLKGGVGVNYAVMRDDVGNFVVKNFSSDPERLFKSAKNLATFAASAAGASPGALVAGVGPEGAPEGVVGVGPIGRQLRAIEARRIRRELADYKALGRLASNAKTSLGLAAAEGGVLHDLSAPVDAAAAPLGELIERAEALDVAEEMSSFEGDASYEAPYRVADAAATLAGAYRDLRSSVDAVLAGDERRAHRVAAREAIRAAIARPLADAAISRRAALADLSNTLGVIGAAAGGDR